MKRIFTYFSVVVLAGLMVSSCVDQVFPKGTDPVPVTPGPGIAVTVSNLADYSFSLTLKPEGDVSYYSLAVVEGSAKAVDSMQVYQCKLSNAILSGTVSYKDAKEYTVDVTDLEPNTKYTVYAVAGNTQGNLGKLAVKEVSTSDQSIPVIMDWQAQGNMVAIQYSEPVQFVDGREIWGGYYYKNYLTGAPYKAKTLGTVVSVSGNIVVIKFSEVTHSGAYYTVNYEAGTFVDAANNPCPALESKFTSSVIDDEGTPVIVTDSGLLPGYSGIFGFIPNGDIEYTIPMYSTNLYLTDYSTTSYKISVPEGVFRCGLVDKYVTKLVTSVQGATTTTLYDMAKPTDYYGNTYDVTVKPAGTPAVGDKMSIIVPAGDIMDWWGNVNAAEIVIGPIDILAEPLKLTYSPVCACNYIEMGVTVNDPSGEKYWVLLSDEKGGLEADDTKLVADLVAEIADWAKQDEVSFEEEMATYYAYQGDATDGVYNLPSQTEFEFAGFYLNPDGTLISDVFRTTASTTAFVAPTATTGTLYCPLMGKVIGNSSFDCSIEKVSESPLVYSIKEAYGAPGFDVKVQVDSDGNAMILQSNTGRAYLSYGPIYVEEIYTWNGTWSSTSFYDSINNMFRFTPVYYIAAGYLLYGTQAEYFFFDEPAPTAVKTMSASVPFNATPVKGKIAAKPFKAHRYHK